MDRRNRQRHAETPRLTCELCRTRKVKCDKANPCSNCVSVGVVCVPVHRPRLPRGIHARRQRRVSPTPTLDTGETAEAKAGLSPGAETASDNDFTQRIRHLEELVASMRSSIVSPYSTALEKVSLVVLLHAIHCADLWQPVGDISQPESASSIPWTSSAETGSEKEKVLAEDLGCFWGNLDAEVGRYQSYTTTCSSNWRYSSRSTNFPTYCLPSRRLQSIHVQHQRAPT